jgi:hypothetical protein
MSHDVSDIDKRGDEVVAGQCAIVAASIVALHDNSVLPKHRYCDALHRFCIGMPEEEAVGEAGAVIERMLDLLRTRVGVACLSYETAQDQEILAFRIPVRVMGGPKSNSMTHPAAEAALESGA